MSRRGRRRAEGRGRAGWSTRFAKRRAGRWRPPSARSSVQLFAEGALRPRPPRTVPISRRRRRPPVVKQGPSPLVSRRFVAAERPPLPFLHLALSLSLSPTLFLPLLSVLALLFLAFSFLSPLSQKRHRRYSITSCNRSERYYIYIICILSMRRRRSTERGAEVVRVQIRGASKVVVIELFSSVDK